MTDEKPIPPSKISYNKEVDCANPMRRESVTFSVESQTNEGALNLFKKLREEMKT